MCSIELRLHCLVKIMFWVLLQENQNSLVALLTLLHESMKTLLILMTTEKYFYPLMTWLKLYLERLISVFNILRIEAAL